MNGIVQDEPAVVSLRGGPEFALAYVPPKANSESFINKWWSQSRHAALFTPVPKLSEDHLSAAEEEETWLKRNLFFQSDLVWLLSLEHHRFWSQVMYNAGTMDGLISFLQEAIPYYVLPEFLVNPRIEESYHETAKLVFQVFMRLGTFDLKACHYFPEEKQAEVIYDNYIFTLPILLDLCHLYGRENTSIITKVVETLFSKQPRFLSDLAQVVSFLGEVMKILTHCFCGVTSILSQFGEPIPLSINNDHMVFADMSPDQCRDRLLYLLDTVATTAAFLDIYAPACNEFRRKNFHQRLAVFYNEAVPKIEKKLESIGASENELSLYVDLKHKLSLAKMEMLRLFRATSTSLVNMLLEKRDVLPEEDVKSHVDEYLTMLSDCLGEQTFIRDYHNVYGIDLDLDTIAQISPELDTIKYNYLMESVLSSFPSRNPQRATATCFKMHSSPSNSKEDEICLASSEPSTSGLCQKSKVLSKVSGVELESLITEVKDILPDLGDGFVLQCLEHYEFHSDAVVNAILEDSLPTHLKAMDRTLSLVPEVKKNDIPQRLNVFDNDEFDVMTKDHIDRSKVHKGKRRTVPKNAFDLLNDKAELVGLKDMYHRFGSIDTTGSLYDDEYDDTYDDNVAINEAGTEDDRRHFVVPRVLRAAERVSDTEESEEEEEEKSTNSVSRDAFCQNPAEIRARRERQQLERLAQRGGGGVRKKSHNGNSQAAGEKKAPDVVGKPKGQGQEKNVLINRDRKNANKSSRANHNRRSSAQHKRNQGMIPS